MSLVVQRPPLLVETPRAPWLIRRLGPAWPLKALLLLFPVWWALGLASFGFILAAVAMAVQMVRRGGVRLPAGFGVWLLFLVWVLLGVLLLWAQAPGTEPGGGPARLVGYGYRVLWYLAITAALLYPLSLRSRAVPAVEISGWLSTLFLWCVAGGLAAILFPSFEFTSLAERLLPGGGDSFFSTLTHPALATSSEFLGYTQFRPKAPFVYSNTWGNNAGLLLPFFVHSWLNSAQRSRRWSVPVVLALFAIPLANSLNRGLWLGMGVVALYAAFVLLRGKRYYALFGMVVAVILAACVLVTSPLWDTIVLRIETPHSNERRGTVAEVVTTATWQGSPLLGFGTTRKVEGSFASIGGGETPSCHQCAAPPLGTQGFMWRLIFTTGFVGTGLFLGFVTVQLAAHFKRRSAFSVLGCMTLASSLLYFLVYDSLESPLFIMMIAVGLMNRERIEEVGTVASPGEDGHPRAVQWSRS